MPNGKVVKAILPPETILKNEIVENVVSIFKKFQGNLIILEIENTMFSHGSTDVSLGGWDGSKFTTKPKMTLSPTQSCGFSTNEMQISPYTKPKVGTQALARANQPVMLEIRNKRNIDLNCYLVEPAKFPWWEDPNYKVVKKKTIFAKKDGNFEIKHENQIAAMWYGDEPTD